MYKEITVVDEAKNQINDLEHMEAKNNQTEQELKRIQKNKNSVSSSLKTSRVPICTLQGYQKEKRKKKKLEIYLKI